MTSAQYHLDFTFHTYHITTILSTQVTYVMKLARLNSLIRHQEFKEIPTFQLSVWNVSKGASVAPRTAHIIVLYALQWGSCSKALVFLSVLIPIFTRTIKFLIPTVSIRKTIQITLVSKKISWNLREESQTSRLKQWVWVIESQFQLTIWLYWKLRLNFAGVT